MRTGSNTVFVAPVQVGDGAYSGAGAVIRRDVPPGALVLSLAKQQNSEGWVLTNRPDSISASLAQASGATITSSSTPASTEEG